MDHRKASAVALTSLFLFFLVTISSLSLGSSSLSSDSSADDVIKFLDHNAIQDHVLFLSSLGSRVTGYPGCYAAAEYVHDKFVDYGIPIVGYQNYTITTPIDYGANVTIISSLGEAIEVVNAYTLIPNGVQTSPTSPEGLIGPLIYGGYGLYSDFNGKEVNGSIVLMEWNSKWRWLTAAELGARAVIFIESITDRFETDYKSTHVPLYFPRIWVNVTEGLYLRSLADQGVKVCVRSDMRFERKIVSNVYAFVRGQGLPGKPQLSNEVVCVGTWYDSASPIPKFSPGGDEAVSVAVTLETAKYLQQHPSARSVLFIAASGQNFGLEGMRWFLDDLIFEKKEETSNLGTQSGLFVGIDLSSENDFLGGLASGWFYKEFNWWPGGFQGNAWILSQIQNVYYEEMKNSWMATYGRTWKADFTYPQGRSGYGPNYKSVSPPYLLPSEPYYYLGGSTYSYFTLYCTRIFYNTWLDTFERVNFDNVWPQAEFLIFSLHRLLDEQEIQGILYYPTRFATGAGGLYQGGFLKLTGRVVEFDYLSNSYVPVKNAIVQIWRVQIEAPAVSATSRANDPYQLILLTDENGTFVETGLDASSGAGTVVKAFVLNSSGSIVYAPDMGLHGDNEFPSTFLVDRGVLGTEEYPRNFVVFKCTSFLIFNSLDPNMMFPTAQGRELTEVFKVKVNDITTHYEPLSHGYVLDNSLIMVFAPPELPLEIITQYPNVEKWPFAILLNSTESTQGEGFEGEIGETKVINYDTYRIARDLYLLNDVRLKTAASSYVFTQMSSSLHSLAGDHLVQAREALDNRSYDKYQVNALQAWALGRKVYAATRNLITDVINTTIFFFILLIPFAFLFERLAVGSTTAKKQFIYVILIFASLTGFLYFMHPGFRLASNILMILIAFVCLVFTAPLIAILSSESSSIFAQLRKARLGLHFAGISRDAAIVNAFGISVSNMRRRKYRTALTLMSTVLITVGLISFTSLQTMVITREITTQWEAPYEGVYLRNPEYNYLNERLTEELVNRFKGEAVVAQRVWYPYVNPSGGYAESMVDLNKGMLLKGDNGSEGVFMLWGLEPQESNVTHIDEALVGGRWFIKEDERVCIIPRLLAEKIGAKVGDTVKMMGLPLMVVGIIDEDELTHMMNLDHDLITPLDPRAMIIYRVHVYPGELILLPASFLLSFGGKATEVVMKFSNPDIIPAEARELALEMTLTIWGSKQNKVSTYTFGSTYALMGLETLILPFVICALTTFSIMLGNVYERTREISVFAVVGLNPMHVAGMFMAEALIYSVLSGVLGYVLGIGLIATTYKLNLMPPESPPNYSSSFVITAVLFIMGATFASILYPSFRAARSVTPSLERKYKIVTKPLGDSWEISFPFTVTTDQVDAVIAFIHEYVAAFGDETTAPFTVKDLSYGESVQDGRETKSLFFVSRIKPYVQGISQETRLTAFREPEASIWRFGLHLKLLTGERRTWEKNVPRFVDQIRKQLLLWGGLTSKEKESYSKIARERAL